MRHGCQTGVPLDAKQVVQVAEKLQAWHHIDVTPAGIGDDPAHLVLGISAAGINQRIAFQLDGKLGVEVVLVALPPGQKIDLPLDLVFRGQGTMAEVEHDAAIRKRGPVIDFHGRQCGVFSAPFHKLQQRLDGVEQARRRRCAHLATRGRDAHMIGFAGIGAGLFLVAGQGIHRSAADQANILSAGSTAAAGKPVGQNLHGK